MQKLITSEMAKNNKNINNFFGVDNNSFDYVLGSILTEIKYLTQKHTDTDNKLIELTRNVEELGNKNVTRFEAVKDLIKEEIEVSKQDITQKIIKSDENTNKRFNLMQCEITALKNQDNQKAMDILKKVGGIILAVITAIAVAFAMNIVKLSNRDSLDFEYAYCIMPICPQNTPSSQEML